MTDTAAVSPQPMILVAVGGDPRAAVRLPAHLPSGSVVVAADSGLDRLVAAGIPAHHVVGDLDSVAPAVLAQAQADGAVVHRHAADKDATDLELALDLVARTLAPGHAIGRLLVVGAGGGRLDHLLADVSLLAGSALRSFEVTAHLGDATVTVVRPGEGRAVVGAVGEQVSLLPVHGHAGGVTTSGLRWALAEADLVAGTTRAMSNELVASPAHVRIGSGALVVVQPGTVAAPIEPRTTPYDPSPRAPEGRSDDR